MQSIDLYRLTRPYKKYLKLTHINQKSLESFLGIEREDRYNGGELIKIYQSYCQLKDADALSLLLLHNLDDLKGMTKLLPLLAYPLFLKDQDYTLRESFLGRFCERTAASDRRAGSEISCSKADLQPAFLVLSYAPGRHCQTDDLCFRGRIKVFHI